MRYLLIVMSLFLGVATSSCTTGHRPDNVAVSVGINVPVFPRLILVPGYPVYYDPAINLNYFFYDGLYWVFVRDRWYASSWYNGPWGYVEHYRVPLYVLRVPVRYYRQPPPYFRGWHADAPPRWEQRMGRDWEQRHSKPDQWDKRPAPEPAPVPGYQREYSGKGYPREGERQQSIRNENYRYQPREQITQERFKQPSIGRDKGNGGRGKDRR
jgi:hypothetical protein